MNLLHGYRGIGNMAAAILGSNLVGYRCDGRPEIKELAHLY